MTFALSVLLAALTVFAIGAGYLYFTVENLPLEYRLPPPPQKEKINLYRLQREFLKLFPSLNVERRTTTGALPRPLEVLSFVRLGEKVSVVLKAGKKTILLVSGKNTNGWRILGTRGDKVILSYRGTEVVLPIPKPSEGEAKGSTPKVSSGEGLTRVVSREEVRRLMRNYGELLRGVDFVPYTAGGKTEGFRIRYLSPSSIFYKLGFRTGDVIVSVNGVVLKNTDDLFRVVQIVQNEPNVRVKILRNGKPLTLDVRIE